MKILILLSILCCFCGCTDTDKAAFDSLNRKHIVKLYSGGVLIGEWISSGKVFPEDGGAGYKFADSKTGLIVRVQGDVFVIATNK